MTDERGRGDQVRALVIENDPTDDIRRLGTWLSGAGLELDVLRPHAGQPLPADLTGYRALVVMGGEQNAYPGPDGAPGAPWFGELARLLRKAVSGRVATLGVCLGGQLLATAHGGVVGRAANGPEFGPRLVGRRDAADNDPVFARVPFAPDVIQWHHDEIVELPAGAVLLAASPSYPIQAFRLGERAWGTQFHIECDQAMIIEWVSRNLDALVDAGYDPQRVIDAATDVMDDLEEVWRPFAERFAAVAKGALAAPGLNLPLLGN